MQTVFGSFWCTLVRKRLIAVVVLGAVTQAMAGPGGDAFSAMQTDCLKAQDNWLSLAQQGNAEAQFKLGISYEFGGSYGCSPIQSFKAMEWYRKAAEQGNVDAAVQLGRKLTAKEYVFANDYKEALKWWHAAAKQGNADAQFLIGLSYQEGNGVIQDYSVAAKWVRMSADSGHAQAQAQLGTYYEKGQGVPRDFKQAYMWLNLAVARWDGVSRDVIVEKRDEMAANLSAEQLNEAQRGAREWKPK